MRSSAEMLWKKQDAILVKDKTDANYSDNMFFFCMSTCPEAIRLKDVQASKW